MQNQRLSNLSSPTSKRRGASLLPLTLAHLSLSGGVGATVPLGRFLLLALFVFVGLLIPRHLLAQGVTTPTSIPLTLQASTTETDFTTSMVWGDYDNDGDLDLMVGNGMLIASDLPLFSALPTLRDFFVKGDRRNRLYCNEAGQLHSCWVSEENEFTTSVAWGDYDNDGDLDLAVGNAGLGVKFGNSTLIESGAPNRIYRNNLNCPNRPKFESVWVSPENDSTMGVAWGDYNNDSKLDLVVANSAHYLVATLGAPTYENGGRLNRLYTNLTPTTPACALPTLQLDPSFSALAEISFSVAWVDIDNDSDLDLAVANARQLKNNRLVGTEANDGLERLFCNQLQQSGEARLLPCWQSAVPDFSLSMSWGDVDDNGFLDLAVGNGQLWSGEQNLVYANAGPDDDGNPQLTPVWRSADAETTVSLSFGDADGDGDLDLAAGNGNFDGNAPNQIYCNQGGTLQTVPCWSSAEEDITMSVAWGDIDGDGALDLAAGNLSVPIGQQNRLYHNAAVRFPRAFAAWTAPTPNYTHDIAWADIDGDGDLDLSLGNLGVDQLYCNRAGSLTLVSSFQPPADNTNTLAWGDVDGDLDLDLVVGNMANEPNRLYRNDTPQRVARSGTPDALSAAAADECQPQFTEVWQFGENEDTRSLAWGDMDGDGDLDLAVGNGSRNALDLPTGQHNQIYRNEGLDDSGKPRFTVVWQSPEAEATRSLAWGDIDQDGDLDLVVGNSASPNRLYRNDGALTAQAQLFTLAWESLELEDTHSVALGDMDGDGDLDLAIGNTTQSSRVFCNEAGDLSQTDCWRSVEAERTRSLAWGDMDGDGDLDLAIGNQEGPNYIYLNSNGQLTTRTVWVSDDSAFGRGGRNSSYTLAVAWGDIEGDGDLDLAVANSDGQPSGIYLNQGRLFKLPADRTIAAAEIAQRCSAATAPFCHRKATPPFALLYRPGETPGAKGFSTAEIIVATKQVTVPYTLFTSDPNTTINIFPEYSTDGGGHWLPATLSNPTGSIIALQGSTWPTGTRHSLLWNAAADVTRSDNTVFRIRTQSAQLRTPIFWPALGSQSPPFRMVASWYVRVSDGRGQPVAEADLYAAGQFITTTNRAGLVGPKILTTGTDLPLVALVPQAIITTTRDAHPGGVAYTIYQTTLTDRATGLNRPLLSTASGEQSLRTAISMPLVLFNLVVSIEWPATITYTRSISAALHQASDYLFDLTDGQMLFGQVTIYDSGQHWADADIQISAQNTVRPHAFVEGIRLAAASSAIRIGRAWDGNSANQGAWHLANGHRTITHEFGHYGLGLYDEYFRYRVDSRGNLVERVEDVSCTGLENREEATDASNGSAMDWQYSSSELSDQRMAALWGELCLLSAQWQLTTIDVGHGESAWDTVVRRFADRATPARWQLLRPSDRGFLLTGPISLPVGLPDWPQITIAAVRHATGENTTGSNAELEVTLLVQRNGEPAPNIGVTLSKMGGATIEQGRTMADGRLEILGATAGDTVRAASSDGALAGTLVLSTTSLATLPLVPVGGGAVGRMEIPADASATASAASAPYLRVMPSQIGGSAGYGLAFTVHNFDAPLGGQAGVTVIVNEPGSESARFTQAGYSPTQAVYNGQLSFTAEREDTNQVQVIGIVEGDLFFLHSTYRLQQAQATERQTIYSSDGKLILELNPQSIADASVYFVVNAQNTTIGPLPAGMSLVGDVYDITASGQLTHLQQPGALTIAYDADLLPVDLGADALGLYWWNAQAEAWQQVDTVIVDSERAVISAPLQLLGPYAIMATGQP